MIRRKYFVSAKHAHNNDTGLYSWWSGIVVTVGFTVSAEDLFYEARKIAASKMHDELLKNNVYPTCDAVEILSMSKL